MSSQDESQLPAEPDDSETVLAQQLGPAGLEAIDHKIMTHAQPHWLKLARVLWDAMQAGDLAESDTCMALHVHRAIKLVEPGLLEGQGNLLRPRWSEIRLPR